MSVSEKERENMSLYSVLLVDDEEEVFQVIMKKLDWEGMGFRIAGYARNGVEALEMAEELSVDVVMTDIKMPYMGWPYALPEAKGAVPEDQGHYFLRF